ncbi:MAG: TIR domain-containing protein [Devosia sp.]
MGVEPGFEYKAFISYSHRDTPWAQWLLQALETYRLPTGIRAELGQRRGIGRVFRDRDEASAASDLKDEIQRALLASEHLIVIASPRSAKSAYVQAEIEAFGAQNRNRTVPGHILTLIVDGEPNAANGDEECFAPALRGGLQKHDGTAFEPLAADARPTGDGKTRALAKLVAGLLNIRYDTLVRRDLQRRARLQWISALASLAAVSASVIVGWIILNGVIERDAALRDNRTVTAVGNAERARRLLGAGDVAGAVALAKTGLSDDGSLPFVPQAYSVLYEALFRDSRITTEIGDNSPEKMETRAISGGRYLTLTRDGVTIWSIDNGVIFRRDDPDIDAMAAPTGDERFVYFSRISGGPLRYDAQADQWADIDLGFAGFDHGEPSKMVIVDGDIVGCTTGGLTRFRLGNEPPAEDEDITAWNVDLDDCSALSLSESGTIMIGSWKGLIIEFDPATGSEVRRFGLANPKFDISLVRASERFVIASGFSGTIVLPREGGAPVDRFGEWIQPEQISPDGLILAEYRSEVFGAPANGVAIHDIGRGMTKVIECICTPIAFIDDKTLLITNLGDLASLDIGTDVQRAIMPIDGTLASASYLARDDLILILGFGLDTVVRRDDVNGAGDNLLVAAPLGATHFASQADFVADDEVIVELVRVSDQLHEYERWRIGEDGTGIKIEDATLDDAAFDNSTYNHQPDDISSSAEVATGPFLESELAGAAIIYNTEAVALVAADGRYLARIKRFGSPIASAMYVARPGLIVIGTKSGDLMVWSANALAAPMIELTKHSNPIEILDLNPSGTAFLSADSERDIRIWPILSSSQLLDAVNKRFPDH